MCHPSALSQPTELFFGMDHPFSLIPLDLKPVFSTSPFKSTVGPVSTFELAVF